MHLLVHPSIHFEAIYPGQVFDSNAFTKVLLADSDNDDDFISQGEESVLIEKLILYLSFSAILRTHLTLFASLFLWF